MGLLLTVVKVWEPAHRTHEAPELWVTEALCDFVVMIQRWVKPGSLGCQELGSILEPFDILTA
jgi:hypothetical protein